MQIKKIVLFFCFIGFINAQTLYQTAKIGLKNNYKIKSFIYQIKSQQFNTKASKDNLFPSINFNSNAEYDKYNYRYPHETLRYNNKVYSYSITIQKPLYNPQILALIKTNKLKEKYINLQKKQYELQFLQDLVQTYIQCITYKNLIKIYQNRSNNYLKIYNAIQNKLKYNLATITDLYQAKANYISANNDLIHAKLSLNNLKEKLFFLTKTKINLPELKLVNISNIIKKIPLNLHGYQKNINLQIYKLNVKIAANQINSAKYKKYPTINLNASYTDTYETEDYPKRNEYRLGISINIPLYNKVYNDTENSMIALYNSSKYDYLNQINTVKISLEQTINNIKQYLEIMTKDKENIKSTKIFLEKEKISYNNHLISLTDLYNAENNYYNALIQYEEDKSSLVSNYINYLNLKNLLSLKKIRVLQALILKQKE